MGCGSSASCNGCGKGFLVDHALKRKKGGLACIRHNNVRDEAGQCGVLATSKSHVSYKSNIFYGTDVTATASNNTAQQGTGSRALVDKVRGDVAIQELWKCGETCILDICVMDTEAKAYKSLSSKTVLEAAVRVKKAKYLKGFLDQQRIFVPLAYSVNGMAGVEVRAFKKRIASLLAAKWNREYNELVGFIRVKMAMAVVRANTLLLHGARLKQPTWIPFVDGATLEVFPGMCKL